MRINDVMHQIYVMVLLAGAAACGEAGGDNSAAARSMALSSGNATSPLDPAGGPPDRSAIPTASPLDPLSADESIK